METIRKWNIVVYINFDIRKCEYIEYIVDIVSYFFDIIDK